MLSFSPREAAAAIGCSVQTVKKYMTEEGLPYSRVRRRIYIVVDDLRAWLEQRRVIHGDELGSSQREVQDK